MTGHEYTIEGVPELNVDWNAEYARQRKDRLQDSIDEYMQDDVDVNVFFADITDCIKDILLYHDKSSSKARDMLNFIEGND